MVVFFKIPCDTEGDLVGTSTAASVVTADPIGVAPIVGP